MPHFDVASGPLKTTHIPNYETYLKRRELVVPSPRLANDLQSHVDSLSAWAGSAINIKSLTFKLNRVDVEEIGEALRSFKGIKAQSPFTKLYI